MKKICIILLLATSVFLTSCSPVSLFNSGVATFATGSQERGLGGFITDGEVRTRVTVAMFDFDFSMYEKININVYEGRVLLTGNVPTKKMQDDAIKLTWQCQGVKGVLNEITVAPKRSASQYVKDKWITTRLEGIYLWDPIVQYRNFEIHTHNGVVFLCGLAQSDAELQKAIQLAQEVDGVKRVVTFVRVLDMVTQKRREQAKKQWIEQSKMLRNLKKDAIYPEKEKSIVIPTPLKPEI